MAVLPLTWWRRLDVTCLVIGSMAPDFEYFVRFQQSSSISHRWIGLLIWNLPITLILAVVFHRVVKWPLVLVAPRFIARRGAAFAKRPWAQPWTLGFVGVCAGSALIGATTHLLWDGFTHSDGFITPHVAVLRTPVELPVFGEMILHRVLQHVSTLVGSLVVAIVVARALYRIAPIELPPRPRVWPRLLALASVGTGAVLAQLFRHWRTGDYGAFVVIVISGALAGALVASIALWRTAQRSQNCSSSINPSTIGSP